MRRNPQYGILAVLAVLAALALTLSPSRAQTPEEALVKRAALIHQRALTIDTHIDWPSRQFRTPDFQPGEPHTPGARGSGQWDLMRMRAGGLDAVFMSIFTAQGPRTEAGHAAAQAHALALIDLTKKMVQDHANLAALALSPEDARRLEKEGKAAIFMGMENGYPLGTDLQRLREFYDLGVRYLTLSHTRNNEICDSSTDTTAEWGGLSPLGEKVVAEMNRLGMLVDVSHVHDDTFADVLALTKAPVIASHSSARARCDHPRNMSDDMLRAVKQNGGVVQLCLLGNYIKKIPQDPARAAALAPLQAQREAHRRGELSAAQQEELAAKLREINAKHPLKLPLLEDAMAHLDHMVAVMGIDHVGIGSDFDGGGGLVNSNDVSEMPNITLALVRRGYSENDIHKIWGGNLLRVFATAEKVARRLQEEAAQWHSAN